MLDLMRDRFFWPHMAVQAKEHIGKCCPCLAFKARQPKVPLENIVATDPLELVHLDFLCLEPGKGWEENVLVITDHFTRYAQAYVTRTQTAQTIAKTLWDKFIIHYGLPKKILTNQGRNFESNFDQYAWDIYPRKRSQSGRITLEHWSMHTTALKTQPWGSAPTTSCLADNLTFWLM